MAGRIVGADRAWDAARRESWAGAYEELRALDPAHMEPCDLEALADAAWWLSRSDESIAARQRAYAGYVAAGENPRAAWCAWPAVHGALLSQRAGSGGRLADARAAAAPRAA